MKNKLILEFTEFNLSRMNTSPSRLASHVDNPQLSIGAFDKHEDTIRSGVARINSIINTLSNSTQFRSLKSKLALEDQKITQLKVLRIFSPDNVNFEFYISFVIADKEYFGVVKNLTSKNPELSSEVFKDFKSLIQTPEWIKRLQGIIIKELKSWLRPPRGIYKLLRNKLVCYSVMLGKRTLIKKDEQVEVVESFENKIVIKYKDELYNLVNDNFIYFNYWFEKV